MINDANLVRISEPLIRDAKDLCARSEHTVCSALQQLNGWSSSQLMAALGESFGYPVLDMPSLQKTRPNFQIISFSESSQQNLVLTVFEEKPEILVLPDPFDADTEEWALRRCAQAGIHPQIHLAYEDDISAFLAQHERELHAMDGFESAESLAKDEDISAVISLASINEENSAVVKLVNSTIYDALKMQASDIHLECDAGSLHILYRIDGVLVPITQINGVEMTEQVISRIKVISELDIAERRIPQDGRFKVRVNGREIDFRVSVMPNIFGEDAVLRLLDRQSLTEEARSLRLDHLGLDEVAMSAIRRLAAKPHGMLLVTGPTGSGKTTTLYAAITEIHNGRSKIITIEDPVEYRLPRVLQIPVNEKKGLTFARGLRSILRHDPDKIMVGEIRDDETAQIAVQAALTGHLVFTTVHANNVFDVLGRFLHMGVDAYSFAAALNGIVAQRLLRQNCSFCSVTISPSLEELATLELSEATVQEWHFKKGMGCGHCRGVGYKGRKAIAEVLILDDELREMIVQRAPISSLKERAIHCGLQPIRESALNWVARGETTLEEVIRVTG